MNWKNATSNYDGKKLKTIVEIDDHTALFVSVYYQDEYKKVTNSWGVSWNERTGKYLVMMHVSKMHLSDYAWSGGLGTFVQVYPGAVERRTMKLLEQVTNGITEADIMVVGIPQSTKPSLIVG